LDVGGTANHPVGVVAREVALHERLRDVLCDVRERPDRLGDGLGNFLWVCRRECEDIPSSLTLRLVARPGHRRSRRPGRTLRVRLKAG
jgi:hypothetical protein